MNFPEKYTKAAALNNSLVCVGLDPDLTLMPKSVLGDENPLWAFNRKIIDATKDKVAAYKMNYAFYIASGSKGLKALEMTIDAIPDNIPVILDVKTGDIANTMVNYAKGYYEYLKADALTVNPLMGEDVIKPLLEFKDKFIFVLALTSNPSAADFLKRNSLYKDISTKIDQWGYKQVGAVVGATNSEELKEVRELMPKTIFLVPGIGAQGGSLKDVMSNAAAANHPALLINSSRGIIHKSREDDFDAVAAEQTDKLRAEINTYL